MLSSVLLPAVYAIGLGAAGAGPAIATAPIVEVVQTQSKRRRRALMGDVSDRYRNKRKPGRPNKKRNMLHVSAWTRRKHRRARKAA